MASDKPENVEKKRREGWITAALTVEAMAIAADKAESALRLHIDKMAKEDGIIVYKTVFHKSEAVNGPFQGIEKAYSTFCEIELVASNFDNLINITMHYGPSSVEILEPHEIKIDLAQAQNIVNNISELLHRYAAMGAGGIVVRT